MSRKLVLLTYNIKPGVPLEEYVEYTREVDYPVFHQNPNIEQYSNFVIKRQGRGGGEWFKHFDLMFVNDLDAFDAGGKLHFGDQLILDHAARWREKWGQDPATGWRTDVNINYAEEI
ncbi:hypothetical protein [Nakamurella leprariae]|uniref:Uncharacterized protein n=1 Tax=Nakamurella leprariae TaxID=2803911 RepID=A0A938Y644_9ACTN|nr:hypothetical protein [Nakamurella leprariae]MBM9466470.1 hypothetical protein [Nakamurella leprariae]